MLDSVSDKHLTKHISGLFSKLIHLGQGEEGKRSIEIRTHKDLFLDFQFKEAHNFNYVFKVPYSLNVKKERKEVTLTVSAFKTKGGDL